MCGRADLECLATCPYVVRSCARPAVAGSCILNLVVLNLASGYEYRVSGYIVRGVCVRDSAGVRGVPYPDTNCLIMPGHPHGSYLLNLVGGTPLDRGLDGIAAVRAEGLRAATARTA